MAGMPFFPLDTHLDIKMDLIESEFGITGFGVIVKLWQKIYGSEGYYIEWTKDTESLFASKIHVKRTTVSEIIKAAIKRDLFDSDMYNTYAILTSRGIQRRHFNMLKRHKEVRLKRDYLLVEVDQILKNVNIIMENVNIQGENVNISKQIRLDKNRIDKIRKDDRGSAAADKVIHKYEQMIGFVTPAVMEGIDFVIGEGMEPELVSRIIEYACEQGKRSWQYINAALLGNLKENILTLDAYNRHQAERTEGKAFQQKTPEKKAKRSKFNNYNDSNKKDYSKIQEDILKELLEE